MKVHRLSILSHAAPEAEVVWDNKGADRISQNKLWLRSFRNVCGRVTLGSNFCWAIIQTVQKPCHPSIRLSPSYGCRDHDGHGISQWETPLQCNVVSYWLSPCPELSLGDLVSDYFPANTLGQRQCFRHFADKNLNAFSSKSILIEICFMFVPKIQMTSQHWSG